MKKISLMLAMFIILPTVAAFAASDEGFSDVHEKHPNTEAVQYLKSKAVVDGYSDGTYKPDQTINRAEFLKIVIGALTSDASGSGCFSDVADEWFAPYVCYAKKRGIISGYADGTFKPDQNISFVEASKVISNAFSLPIAVSRSAAEWYEPYVKALEGKKAIPVTVDYFSKSVTRGEMAEITYRLSANKTDKATKTLVSFKNDFPQITSCDELQEKMEAANYRTNYRYRVMYKSVEASMMMEDSVGSAASSEKSEAADYSQTNIQVAGVDEGDTVKNDGKHIYLLENSKIQIVEAYPPSEMKVVKTIEYDSDDFNPRELYLSADRLAVIGGTYSSGYQNDDSGDETSSKKPSNDWQKYRTRIDVYDVSNPSSPSLLRTSSFDGSLLSSRRIDDRVYIASQMNPQYWILEGGNPIEEILPAYDDSVTGVSDTMVNCTDIRFFPRYETPNFLVVASVPLSGDADDSIEKEVFMGAGQTIYSSLDNLYVGMQKYDYDEMVRYDIWEPPVQQTTTVFYQFALKDGKVTFNGTGSVPGTLLNQFSMDEHEDSFRVATTTGSLWDEGENISKNHLYVLDKNNLGEVRGKIEDIAPGEKIYSVRFMGDRAYMVTFKKVDPFFVIDVSNPENPQILGKLKIPGYSDYLHPYDETHIIGFGKEAADPTEEEAAGRDMDFAWYQGMKMAVFDVSDVANPKEMFKEVIGDRGTESPLLSNHKALLFDKSKDLLAFPVVVAEIPGKEEREYTGNEYGEVVFSGAYVYTLNMQVGFALRGKITHVDDESIYTKQGDYWYGSNADIDRVLYIGEYLYSVSPGMVKASTMSNILEEARVQWEVPEQRYYYLD